MKANLAPQKLQLSGRPAANRAPLARRALACVASLPHLALSMPFSSALRQPGTAQVFSQPARVPPHLRRYTRGGYSEQAQTYRKGQVLMNLDLRGLIPALATPLNSDFTVDTGALKALVNYVIEGGARGIFALSSTGEGPMLTDEQKRVVVTTAAEASAGRAAVLMHIPDTSTERVVNWARVAPDLGAQAVVSTLPFYFHHEDEQTLYFYRTVADASPLPLFLYNVPYCTGVKVTDEQVAELAEHPNIVGIKDSTQDWRHFQRIIYIKDQRPDFLVFTGDEESLGSSVLMGADGGVLGLGNVCPALCTALIEAAERRDVDEVRRLQRELTDLQQMWFVFSCASGALKRTLHLLGLAQPYVTPPLIPAPEQLDDFLRDLLSRHGLL